MLVWFPFLGLIYVCVSFSVHSFFFLQTTSILFIAFIITGILEVLSFKDRTWSHHNIALMTPFFFFFFLKVICNINATNFHYKWVILLNQQHLMFPMVTFIFFPLLRHLSELCLKEIWSVDQQYIGYMYVKIYNNLT